MEPSIGITFHIVIIYLYITNYIVIYWDTADAVFAERYGWWRFKPDYLQRLVSPRWALIFCCPGPFIQGVLINGLLHFFIPTLERQFELSSIQSGLVSSGYDMAATACLIPLAAVGGRRESHRPRLIGLGLVLLGTGAIIFSSPGLLADYHLQKGLNEPRSKKSSLGWILFVGNLFHGAGATPVYSIAVTLIDDCFPIHSSSFYMSIYYTMAVIGPLVGIAVSGALSYLSVNFLKRPINEPVEPDDPNWVGCWWLGFLLAGLICYIASLPILGFPREIPEIKANRDLRDLLHPERTSIALDRIGELPRNLGRLLKNLKYLFLTLAACCEGFIFSGMAAFMTKLLLQQFGLGPKNQAIFKAILAIPSSLIGMLGGGWVIKFFSMNLRQILTMIVCLMSISFPCIGGMFIYCAHDEIVGFTETYLKGRNYLEKDCNKNCGCDESFFFPICGTDNKTYFSGCYAGCSQKYDIGRGVDVFLDCKCILRKDVPRPDAIEGFCATSCPALAFFAALIFIYQTLTFFCVIPIITSTLRVVHSDVRSLGVALQWVMGRLLGTIPGPLLFGKAIDDSCRYWQRNSDGSRGSCLHYHHLSLSRNLAMLVFSSKLLQITFFAIALRLSIIAHKRRTAGDQVSATSAIW